MAKRLTQKDRELYARTAEEAAELVKKAKKNGNRLTKLVAMNQARSRRKSVSNLRRLSGLVKAYMDGRSDAVAAWIAGEIKTVEGAAPANVPPKNREEKKKKPSKKKG